MASNQVKNVLLVDDDPEVVISASRALKQYLPGIQFHGAGTEASAIEQFKKYSPGCVVVDLELDTVRGPVSGFDLISILIGINPNVRIIVLTGHSGLQYGIEAIKRGAVSFQEKPAQMQVIAVLIEEFLNQYALRVAAKKSNSPVADIMLDELIGSSKVINKLKGEILFAASTNQSVFLAGESGVGKSLCAKLIHKLSARKLSPFIRYQPSFISSDLVNSDLFGHNKGSFTGALADRIGLLAEVDGGTIFLDEVEALPLDTQVLLLGVLQDKTFRSLGSNKEQIGKFRVISASNQPIDLSVTRGTVRKDFYFRLAHHTICIPALRDRIGDIPELIAYFLEAGRNRKDFSVLHIDDAAIAVLKDYSWPGNIRELQSVIEGAAYRAQFNHRSVILSEDISIASKSEVNKTDDAVDGFHARVLRYKKKLIREALNQHDGNQVRAAKQLGMDRSSMRRIIEDEL